MRNAVSWAGSLFRALSLEVSLTLTGSLRTPLRRDAWSLSALHKACQACLLTVCGRVRAGQRDRLCQRNTGELQFDAKGEKISALHIHSIILYVLYVFVFACSIFFLRFWSYCISTKSTRAKQTWVNCKRVTEVMCGRTYLYPPNDAAALTELKCDNALLLFGVNLCLTQEIRQPSKTTLWPNISLQSYKVKAQNMLTNTAAPNIYPHNASVCGAAVVKVSLHSNSWVVTLMSVWIEADGLHWRRWTVVKPEQVQTKGEREKIRLQNKNCLTSATNTFQRVQLLLWKRIVWVCFKSHFSLFSSASSWWVFANKLASKINYGRSRQPASNQSKFRLRSKLNT